MTEFDPAYVKIDSDDAEGKHNRDQLFFEYGRFMAIMGGFDIALEIAARRVTGLTAVDASIIFNGMTGGPKGEIVAALLTEHGQKEEAAKVRKVIAHAKRNPIVHGLPAARDDYSGFAFVKRETNGKYTVRFHEFTAQEFVAHVDELLSLYNAVITALHITLADVEQYGREARFSWPSP